MAEDKNAKTGASRLGLSLKAKNGVFAVPGKKNVSRRWLYVLGGSVVFLIIIITSMSKKATLPPPRKASAPAINLTPTGMAQRSWEAQSQTQIQRQKDQIASQAAEISALKSEMDQIRQAQEAAKNSAPPPSSGASGSGGTDLPPPPPPPPPIESGSGGQAAPEGPYVFAPKPLANADVSASGAPAGRKAKALQTSNTAKTPPGTGILLTGSFVKVALLNGVDAGTSSQTRSNPEPVLLRVQDNAVLPGSTHFRLRSCFMLGSAYGSLSSERVYIRLAELSCVDRHRKLVLSQPVRGYVVDSDSMLGLRGRVIDRQGAKIGKALLAGFAQGLANAFGGAQGTMTTSAIGTMSTISGSAAVKAAGLTGAATASSQLAQFYLQQAESIFPVIRVAGGRLATAVFTSNVPLEWGHVQGVTKKSSISRGT